MGNENGKKGKMKDGLEKFRCEQSPNYSNLLQFKPIKY